MLQKASGKLFTQKPAQSNELRGIVHTNLQLYNREPIETAAGRLLPTSIHRPLTSLLADGISHGTAHLPSSRQHYLTARGIGEAAAILGFDTPSDFVRAYPVSRESAGSAWCPGKEGRPKAVNTIMNIWRPHTERCILFLDNDFFGQPKEQWQARIDELREGRFKVNFS